MDLGTIAIIGTVATFGTAAVAIKDQRAKVRIRTGRGTARDRRHHAGLGLRNAGGIQAHDDGALRAHVASLPHNQPGKRDPMEVPETDQAEAATTEADEAVIDEREEAAEATTAERRPVVVVATTRFGVRAGDIDLDYVPEIGDVIHIGDEDFDVERILTIDGVPQAADPGDIGTLEVGDDEHVIDTGDGPGVAPGPETENASHAPNA